MHKWHENNSVGQLRCDNEIHEFFFPFDPFLCSAGRVLSEYHSHTPGSFLELGPPCVETNARFYTKTYNRK